MKRTITSPALLLVNLALYGLFFTSCSLNTALIPSPDISKGQVVEIQNERQVLLSSGKSVGVGINAYMNENNDLVLHIVYANNAGRPLIIRPQLITVMAEHKSGKLIPLKVYTAHEYIDKLQANLAAERIERAIEGMLDPQPESLNPYLRLYAENTLTPIKSNPFAWERDVLPLKMKFGDDYNTTKLVFGFQQPLLTKMTLNANQFVEGDVIVRYRKGHSFIITVPVEKEIHRFTFYKQR